MYHIRNLVHCIFEYIAFLLCRLLFGIRTVRSMGRFADKVSRIISASILLYYKSGGRCLTRGQIRMARDFNLTGTATVPDDVQIAREALYVAPPGHPDRAMRLDILAFHLGERYVRVGATADFEEAREHAQETVKLITPDDSNRAKYLHTLAVILVYGYQASGTIGDLEEAIRLTQDSVISASNVPGIHAKSLSHLALCYYHRFKHLHLVNDIDEAIRFARAAIDQHPAANHQVLRSHCNLADLLFHRYFFNKELTTLNEALSAGNRAIEGGPDGHVYYAVQLRRLGQLYHERYQMEGKIQDIDLAAQILQDALEQTQTTHPDHSSAQYYFGLVFLDRFRRTGRSEDLEAALQTTSSALYGTPHGHEEKPARTASLGAVYHEQFHRSGKVQVLETAIQLYQTSVKICPHSHLQRAQYLHNLGKGHMDWYKSQKTTSNLEIAIRLVEEAARLTLANDIFYSSRMETLGHLHKEMFFATRSNVDLNKAFEMYRKAAEGTPTNHPDRAHRLRLLGLEHRDRYKEKGSTDDFDKTIELFQDALRSSSSIVRDRIAAGKDLVTILAEAHTWESAAEAACAVSDLISLLTSFPLKGEDKRFLVSDFAGFASDAAAIALNARRSPVEAIQLLELVRGVIAGSLAGLNCDLWSLNHSHPELAARFISLRDKVDLRSKPGLIQRPSRSEYSRPSQPMSTRETRATQSYGAAQDLERIISEIRSCPGFQDFQRPVTELAIKKAATCGPIVVINISDYRCDAIIIQEHSVQVMPLLALKKVDIEDKVRASELGNLRTLQWLWYTIVGPVLDALAFKPMGPSTTEWPHMWWMPTDQLCQFPLHAAGVYATHQSTNRITESAMDRVISSYSSSTKLMLQHRANNISESFESNKAVLIAMENTLGKARLPFAKLEIAQIQTLCESMKLEIVQTCSLREQLMSDLMESCKIFHFAGHGHADPSDAFDSHLCIGDEHLMERLTVADLWKLNLGARPPLLAYLSACSTGRTHDGRSVEERLDLINAFQVAGFRNVIGTLWEVRDEDCVDIARMTYECMGEKQLTDASVSQGLHHATREMRNRWLRDLPIPKGRLQRDAKLDTSDVGIIQQTANLPWVSYVHYGG